MQKEKRKKQEDHHIVSSPKEQGNKGYKKSDFRYNKEEDNYICPMGKKLTKTGNKEIKYMNTKACKECPNREKCTNNKRGRTIKVGENEEYLERAKKRQQENMDLYKQRQMIVEHVFGTIKRDLGYTYLLLRGSRKVKGESYMHFLIYNIKRVCNIKNIKDIIDVIKAKEKEIITESFVTISFLAISWKCGSPRTATPTNF